MFTGIPRGGGRVALELELIALGIDLPPLKALSPPDLRESRALPPDPQELARPTATDTIGARPTSPTRPVRPLLQHPRPHRALGRRTPAQAYQARPKATALPAPVLDPALPGPPRPRQRRRHHSAPQQPPSPHRTRPSPQRPTRARPGRETSTSASSPNTANYSANSPSTPPPTTSHNKHRERCPATTAHDVSRHRSRAPGRIRTSGLRIRRPPALSAVLNRNFPRQSRATRRELSVVSPSRSAANWYSMRAIRKSPRLCYDGLP